MLTRCPACTTTFRITPDQLRARGGRVRCGRCEARFNALEALQDEPPPQPAGSVVPEPAPDLLDTQPHREESIISSVPDNSPGMQPTLHEPTEAETDALVTPSLRDDTPDAAPASDTPVSDAVGTPGTVGAPVDPPAAEATAAAAELRHTLTHFLLGTPVEKEQTATVPAPRVTEQHQDAMPAAHLPAEEYTVSANVAPEPVKIEMPVEAAASGIDMPDTDVVPPVVPAESVSAVAPSPPIADNGDETRSQPETTAGPADPALPEPLARPLATFGEWQDASSLAPVRRWPWAIAALLASATFLAQAALHYRVELAVLQPQLKPLLARACKPLGCTVTRPRKAEFLGIEASDLHPDPDLPGRLLLSATLRNRAPFVQEFPLLEVTLNDVADRPLIVRDLKPDEYLPADIRAVQGFGINAEIAVNLTLDVGEVPAAGYRLYLFYP